MRPQLAIPLAPLHPDIFRAYDIRGICWDSLTPEIALNVGRAFVASVVAETGKERPTIVTARDGRKSSPVLSESLIQGMTSVGADITDLGIGPSPMCYFGLHHLGAEAGIMVTGSHNPPTHNGFKMLLKDRPFYGDDIQKLYQRIANHDYAVGQGTVKTFDIRQAYVDELLRAFHPVQAKPLTVVWDPGNGAAGEITQMLCEHLPGHQIAINAEIDGRFPNHHPDPTIPANLQQLIVRVKKENADLGVAFDGDGDRIGCIDNQGNILWGDQMLAIFAREILSRKPGAIVIADVKASQTLFDDVAAHGGQPLMWKTGHSLIKAKIKETGAAIAGEMSGHIFFSDGYYGFDDGLYAAIRMIDILAHSDQSLAELRASLPSIINTPEIRVDCPEGRKFSVIEEIRQRLHDLREAGSPIKINEVDGVRVTCRDGWWLARASNTQDAIIVRCESQHLETLEEMKSMVRLQLEASDLRVDLDQLSQGH